ncbi:hypothetical protein R3W88_007585 [Solanum pinnatisectum]|uniref:Peptidase A1 domain-containing protein n=1 Tax=Solanum pinnatisectum TaxID=50273 RepID=A0AAV9M8T2_9SOLN|nr:hypothetical protein R3W88_007585 [Solanum pinnatisectum]
MDYFCCTSNFMVFVLFLALKLHNSREAFGTFRFDLHHRYSDPVKGILDLPWLPKKGSIQYYSAWTQRDRHINRHRLTSTVDTTPNSRRLTSAIDPTPLPLTFAGGGNKTVLLSSLGFLHYANVTVGTPGLSFLVALDIGSDLFWLPCNCNNCAHTLLTGFGRPTDLNIYSPNTSSTSKIVPCNGTLCGQGRQCSVAQSACGYGVAYLSHNTSSSGVLVEDILHLQTDSSQQKAVEVPITLGCGMKQTGAFLNGAAPNGLFGLSMGNISVPSVLASKGLAANSFSLCFGADGTGRIDFGDKGSLDQGETPFNLEQTQANQTYFQILDVNLIMKGGNQFYLFDPIITLSLPDGSTPYCLAVVKSGDINIIGQNFMTGYQVVFDREKMVLGWKPSDCYDSKESKSKTILPVNKQRPTEGSENGNGTIRSTPEFTSTSAGNYVTRSLTFFCQLVVVLFFLYSHYLII